jgi:tryptophan synthase alpha chain
MNRIDEVFRQAGHPVLVAFTVAGDPDEKQSIEIVRAMIRGGADIIEFGLPFSDPTSDGPVIQRADLRALQSGMNADRLFSMVETIRTETAIPIVILTYANLIHAYGAERFYVRAAKAGIDGVVIADAPIEESEPYQTAAVAVGMYTILMAGTTTSPDRVTRITAGARGFIYMVAVLGVTGTRTGVDRNAIEFLQSLKKATKLPILPGFGISTPEQVQTWVQAGADGVIVGSAIVREIEEHLGNPEAIPPAVEQEVKRLVSVLRE